MFIHIKSTMRVRKEKYTNFFKNKKLPEKQATSYVTLSLNHHV
jgi:hypothetical protein